jgi:hypothetical protein
MYKRVVFVDETDKKLMQNVKNAKDLYVVPVQGLKEGQRQVVQAEFGGSSPQQWEMIAQKRERLDRNSGIFDAQRGMVAGRGTATEVAVADESSSARMAFIEHQFQDATARVLSSVAWYLYHDDRVDFPLGARRRQSRSGCRSPGSTAARRRVARARPSTTWSSRSSPTR